MISYFRFLCFSDGLHDIKNGHLNQNTAPDLLPSSVHFDRISNDSCSSNGINNNEKSGLITFEKAFRLSQLSSRVAAVSCHSDL